MRGREWVKGEREGTKNVENERTNGTDRRRREVNKRISENKTKGMSKREGSERGSKRE